MGLHAWSISYCDAKLTDGFIPLGAWPSLPGIVPAVHKLERSGLWVACDGGYRLHDYLDYNRSRARVTEIQAKRQANGQAGGQASATARAQAKSKQNGKQSAQAKSNPRIPDPGLISSSSVGNSPERGGVGGKTTAELAAATLMTAAARAAAAHDDDDDDKNFPDEVRQRLARASLP